eukprot:PhF_6_TR3305/c0_g1_i1/m.4660
MSRASPEDVLKFSRATEGFLCSLSANVYGIEFLSFRIRDMDTNNVVFDVRREATGSGAVAPQLTPEQEIAVRTIRYEFPAQFLKFRTVGTTLTFAVGPQPVPNFRMIERHYFKDRLVKSFDFNFGFCIPNSVNTWEAIYEMPALSAEEEAEMLSAPFQTKSDSFYFVNDEMVMHNKAEYAYL